MDIGVRVEVRNEVMETVNRVLYESKLVGYPRPFKNKVRTFCQNPGGFVSQENYDNNLAVVNGHSYKEKKSDNTNLSILCSHNFSVPFNQPIAYAQKVGELTNMLANGQILVQRFGDILDGKRTWQKELAQSNIRPTLPDAVAGDITAAMPYRAMTNIINFIQAMDYVVPGFAAYETLLYSPELKFYSNRVKMDTDFNTSLQGLHCLGDSSGWTRGLMMASVMGVLMGRKIAEEAEFPSARNMFRINKAPPDSFRNRRGFYHVGKALRLFLRLVGGDVHADAVDLHAVIGGDQEILAAVDDPGLDEIAVFRGDGDLHLRGGDLKLAALDDIHWIQCGVFAVLLFAVRFERLHLFGIYAAVGQYAAHVGNRQLQRLRIVAFLVVLDLCPDLLMDGLHYIIAASLIQRLRQRRIKNVFLFCRRHGRLHPEQRVNDLLMQLRRVLGVEQQVIDVGGAAVKGGVQEAKLRGQRDMAGGAGMEFVQVMIVPQLQSRGLYRADGADKVAIHRVPRVRLKLIVPALVGHIVGVRRQ